MKIGIITFHAAHNYGSMLLAFALQEAVKKLGHEVKIINLRIPAQNLMYANPIKFTHKLHIKTLCMHPGVFYGNLQKWNLFESFTNQHHQLTSRCMDLNGVKNVIKDENFDVVIAGGDQIWNMQCADFSIAYYLPFNMPEIKKISYAPSFGGGGNFKVDEYSVAIAGLLSDFDCISVREQQAAEQVSELIKRHVDVVCDPVMLSDRSVYDKMAGDSPLIKEKYLFYYSPFSTPEKEHIVLEYGKQLGVSVYTSNGEYYQCRGMKKFLKVGPAEFLNLIKYADMVCGNSFHLLAFCLLLNKNFIILSGADSRMENLLAKLKIMGHFYASSSEIPTELPPIDWKLINKILAEERAKGIEYLQNSIMGELK